jgi:hypothetical protein
MGTTNSIQQLNRQLADKLNEDANQNPQSPYAGKKVGIANGQVIVVSDDWDEVGRELRQAEPDGAKRFCIEIGADYGGVHEIWGIR